MTTKELYKIFYCQKMSTFYDYTVIPKVCGPKQPGTKFKQKYLSRKCFIKK